MKTLQEQYNLIREGKGYKDVFLKEAKQLFPNMLINPSTFDESIKILKSRGVIFENYIDLKPINDMGFTPKLDWENKFEKFLKEEKAKNNNKAEDNVFDYKDKSNLDNQIGQEVLNGIYFEGKKYPNKTLDELRDIVSKNLEKDGLYYLKNATFGVDGLGYKEIPSNKVNGKYSYSGYSDKLKDTDNKMESVTLKEHINIFKQFINESHNKIGLIVTGHTQIDNNEIQDLIDNKGYYAEWNGREGYWFFEEPEETLDELEVELTKEFNKRNINARFEIQIEEDTNQINEESLEDMGYSKSEIKDFLNIWKEDGDNLPKKVKDYLDGSYQNELGKRRTQPLRISESKKQKSLDFELNEIDNQSRIVAMEAKLDKIDSIIQEKIKRLSLIDEDENISELVDKNKMKLLRKEIKMLEQKKSKMERIYEKTTGNKYIK